MPGTLYAGAARRVINPKLGAPKAGMRLFGDPIQAIESDLTATAVVVGNGETRVVILATDLVVMSVDESNGLRTQVADALGIPMSHVMLNLSHNHSSPALPDYLAIAGENKAIKERYKRDLGRRLVEATMEAVSNLQPARMGTGWGESFVGVYRRELRDGRDVLGEVPGHPIDSSVGVIRFDDLEGNPIATLFRYSAHPVTVGPRSMVASSDFPGPAREVIEKNLGGLGVFLQGCGGNINPRVGIGYEIDCRDTKNRLGLELGGEALKVAANIRTNTKAGARRPIGTVPNILFTPWEPVEGDTCTYLGAVEGTVTFEFGELPSLAEAEKIHNGWKQSLAERQVRDAQEWEIRFATKFELWSRTLVEAVKNGHPTFELDVQVLRINDVILAGMNVETFFETGLSIKEQSPFRDTFVLGYTNGSTSYLPRAEDYPEGGWKLDASYAVPDLIFQGYVLPVAFRPDAEQRAVDGTLSLIRTLEK